MMVSLLTKLPEREEYNNKLRLGGRCSESESQTRDITFCYHPTKDPQGIYQRSTGNLPKIHWELTKDPQGIDQRSTAKIPIVRFSFLRENGHVLIGIERSNDRTIEG
jgi:seryl-tRNA synthetase